MDLNEIIKTLNEKGNGDDRITQKSVADAVGCSQGYLNLIFAGKRGMPARLVGPLARELDIPVEELLNEFYPE